MTPKTSRRKRVPDAQRHTVPGPKPYTPSVEHIESNDNTSEPTVRQTILFSICSQLGRTSVKRSFWAFCQIADVERLSFIARQDSFIIEYIEQQCEATIPQCKPIPQSAFCKPSIIPGCQQERSSRVSDVGSSNSSWSRNYRDIKDVSNSVSQSYTGSHQSYRPKNVMVITASLPMLQAHRSMCAIFIRTMPSNAWVALLGSGQTWQCFGVKRRSRDGKTLFIRMATLMDVIICSPCKTTSMQTGTVVPLL